MKIVFVTQSLANGGAERVVSVLANALSSCCDFQITIISKMHKPAFYQISQNVDVIFPKTRIDRRNSVTKMFSRICLYNDIYSYFKKNRPNLIVSSSTSTNGPVILLSRLVGLPIIASEHTNYKANRSFSFWLIKRYCYPLANIITVLTKRDEVYYCKYLNNVVVMPNPLPFEIVDSPEIFERENCILAIGSLNRWKIKGYDNLLSIFSQIINQNPDWRLKIAGSGDSAYLKSIIDDLGINESVTLLGEVENIQDYMRSCSIFALTSRWEGLPMSLIESMSQGMACIAFDCYTGPSEIITHEDDGILVEDQNVSSFAFELNKLIKDIDLRERLGKSAVESSKRFATSRITDKWLSLINSVLN